MSEKVDVERLIHEGMPDGQKTRTILRLTIFINIKSTISTGWSKKVIPVLILR